MQMSFVLDFKHILSQTLDEHQNNIYRTHKFDFITTNYYFELL